MNLKNPLDLILLLISILITFYSFIRICYFYYIIIIDFFKFFFNFNNNNKNCYKKLNIKELKTELNVHIEFASKYWTESHPLSNYYFKTNDLSLNLECKLKWLKYAIAAFKEIKNALTYEEYIENLFNFEANFLDSQSIQNIDILKNLQNQQPIIILFIKDEEIVIDDDFNIDILIEKLNTTNIKFFYDSDVTNKNWFMISENDTIKLKLKLNLLEYIALTSDKCAIFFFSVLEENLDF